MNFEFILDTSDGSIFKDFLKISETASFSTLETVAPFVDEMSITGESKISFSIQYITQKGRYFYRPDILDTYCTHL